MTIRLPRGVPKIICSSSTRCWVEPNGKIWKNAREYWRCNVRITRSKFGELPITDALDVLSSETMNDEQATWIGDEFERVVGVLGMLEQEHPRH